MKRPRILHDHSDQAESAGELRPLLNSSQAMPASAEYGLSGKNSIFDQDDFLFHIFRGDKPGRELRVIICVVWGLIGLFTTMLILHYSYDFTWARSFYFGCTVMTTVGYSPTFEESQSIEFVFFSCTFAIFVLPFLFLQAVVASDSTTHNSEVIKANIIDKIRSNESLTAKHAFLSMLCTLLLETVIIFALAIFIGAIIFYYLSDQDTIAKATFFSIGAIALIGYGTVEVSDTAGYVLIGLFCILSNALILYNFPRMASYWLVAACSSDEYIRLHHVVDDALPPADV